jgi:hypothetical protein
MQACAAGYALTYLITLEMQLVSKMVVGLTTAKIKPPVLLVPGLSLSNTSYIRIYTV